MVIKIYVFCFLLVTLFFARESQAQNPVIRDIFTADPAPLVYNDTVFM